MKTTIVFDQSAIAFDRWYAFPGGTSPELEQRDFLREYAKRIYNLVLNFGASRVIFAMDSRVGYWRTDVYRDWYLKNCSVATDVAERVWMRHDNQKYLVVADGFSEKTSKIKLKKGAADWEFEPSDSAFVPAQEALLDVGLTEGIKQHIREHLPSYKGSRKKREWGYVTTQEKWHELRHSSALIASRCFPGKCICVDRAEADDVAFELVQNRFPDEEIVLVTSDADWDQLVGEGVTRYDFQQGKTVVGWELGQAILREKILSGDTSDCIKGIALPGKSNCIGLEGARKMLNTLSPQEILAQAKEEGWHDQLKFNTRLVQLGRAPEEIRAATLEIMAVSDTAPTDTLEALGLTKSEIHQIRLQAAISGV